MQKYLFCHDQLILSVRHCALCSVHANPPTWIVNKLINKVNIKSVMSLVYYANEYLGY